MYKLLIVDDEAMIRRGLSTIIPWEEMGYDLAGAVGNADEALSILSVNKVDVLLTDISMPEMNGLMLIEKAKEYNSQLRSVVISGYSEFDYAIEAIKLKVENYILKPLDPDKIITIFKELKKSLDEMQNQTDKLHQIHEEYDLMRILYSDIHILKDLNLSYAEKRPYQLLLLKTGRLINENETEHTNIKQRLQALSMEYFCRHTETLTAWIVPEVSTDGLIQKLKDIFSKQKYGTEEEVNKENGVKCEDNCEDNCKDMCEDERKDKWEHEHGYKCECEYRIVVGTPTDDLINIVSDYMNLTNHLKRIENRSICFVRTPKKFRKSMEDYLALMIRSIETGKDYELEKNISLMFSDWMRNGSEDAEQHIKTLLERLVLYFRIENLSFLQLDSFRYQGNDWGKLKRTFQDDLNLILGQLKDNSEALAIRVSYQARQYINQHYDDKELSLRQVAELLYVSYGYLSTVFTKTFGENFKSYLVSVRIEKARELLMKREYKIYEIADLVGYSSSRYFTDAFKKRYGLSPVDYVNQINKGLY